MRMPRLHERLCAHLAQLASRTTALTPRARSASTAASAFARAASAVARAPPASTHPRGEFDIVIVGGGVVGASVAYHTALLDPRLRVCVIERDTRFVHASAVLSAGGIRQQFSLPANIELSLYGAEFLKRIHCDLHVPGEEPPDPQFKPSGYLFLASEEGEATLRRNHQV